MRAGPLVVEFEGCVEATWLLVHTDSIELLRLFKDSKSSIILRDMDVPLEVSLGSAGCGWDTSPRTHESDGVFPG